MGLDAETSLFSGFKGILFDVDGTLYHQVPLRLTMCFWLATLICRPIKFLKTLKIIYNYRRAQEELRHSKEQIGQIALTVIKTGESLSDVESVVQEWFERRPLCLIKFFRRKGVSVVLGKLQEKGVKLGVFSDYPAHTKIQALGLSSYFSIIMSASDKDVEGFKPDSNGFELAAQQMGLRPDEIVYVGDRVEVDGLGAKYAGMKPVIIGPFQEGLCPGCIYIRSMRELYGIAAVITN